MSLCNDIDREIREMEDFLSLFPLSPEWNKYRSVEVNLFGCLNPTKLIDEFFFKDNRYKEYKDGKCLDNFMKFYTDHKDIKDALNKMYVNKAYKKHETDKDLSAIEFRKSVFARIYRTLIGIFTEYTVYLMCKKIFGWEAVTRSVEHDRKGVDFTICFMGVSYRIHVYVDSKISRERRIEKIKTKNSNETLKGYHVNLIYSWNDRKNTINLFRKLKNGFFVCPQNFIEYLKGEMEKGNIKNQNILDVEGDKFVYAD